jgi:hypothetical protein
MKSLLDSIGSHVVTEMKGTPTSFRTSQTVQSLPVAPESAVVAFLAQQEALRNARRNPR